jgi:serine/threonine protein kinase
MATSELPGDPSMIGPTLAEVLADRGPLPEQSVRIMASRLAGALRASHAAAVVHGTVNPSNVLLTGAGPRLVDSVTPGVLDRSRQLADKTADGAPGFLAPEQLEGHDVGPAADIFSLAAVLVFALTGEPPAVLDRAGLPGVPAGLRPVLQRCLAIRPGDRPTPDELLAALGTPLDAGNDPWIKRLLVGGALASVLIVVLSVILGLPAAPPAPSGPGQSAAAAASSGFSDVWYGSDVPSHGGSVSVALVNSSSVELQVWHVSPSGDTELAANLNPGDTYRPTGTSIGQVWRICSPSGCLSGLTLPGNGELVIVS